MNLTTELAQYNKTFKTYCTERNERKEIAERALALIDEMKQSNEAGLMRWLKGEGKTLLLQENLRATTYCGNKGDNAPSTLDDFNAFALLDTVSGYNNRNWNL
jgi:hypothetical protein